MFESSYKESDVNKVNDFVEHLLSSPGIKSEPLLAGEKKIVHFIAQNLPSLKITFRNSRFFPHLEFNQVLELISENLYSRVSGVVLPVINEFINNADFKIMDKFSDAGTVSDKFRRERLHDFVQIIFSDRDSRFNMTGTFNIFKYSVIEKYMEEIFKRRDYLYHELTGAENLKIELSEYIILLKTMLLIRNKVYMKLPLDPSDPDKKISVNDIGNDREMIRSYVNSIVEYMIPILPGIPEKFIRLAVKSAFRADLLEQNEISSKLIFILNSRFNNYKHISKTDRGAESPDESWFAVALKNAGYYGYDRLILDALYLIAGENNW
ncbi:MAG: hypothetical protein CVV49_12170 [Spirochaetae bacterium HGW-Spirochaetae-5]|nr:MAG: hypothetical protein CVV49_12170 [Spirochaetae bacterium HGW-Spirochaetae-5]